MGSVGYMCWEVCEMLSRVGYVVQCGICWAVWDTFVGQGVICWAVSEMSSRVRYVGQCVKCRAGCDVMHGRINTQNLVS